MYVCQNRSLHIFSCFLSVGAILTANAKDKGMFLGGRFLTGNLFFSRSTDFIYTYTVPGLGSTCAAAPSRSYLAEMAPAHSRGAYLGFLNSL